MALDEQVIGSLDSYQPNPALASGASAVMPFNPQISEQVLGQLASITNNAIKKREDDFKTWETNLAREYSNLKVASDVYDADRELLSNERKNAFGAIAKNSIYLAPAYQLKNPEKYQEIMAKGQSYLEKAQMSKDDKLFEKSIIDMMKKDSSYDNVVNQKRLEKFRSSPLGERERFVPVADNSLDLMRQAKNIRELTKGDSFTDVQTDPASQTTSTTTKYEVPDDQFVAVVAPINDAYNRAYFNDIATDEEKALGYDVWNRNKILATKPPEYVDKASVRANEVYKQENQNARNTENNQTRISNNAENNQTKRDIAQYNAEVKANPEFDKVNTAIEMIDGLKNNVEFSLDPSGLAMLNKYSNSNYTKAQKLNSANIPPDLIPKIFKGGKTEYGEAYGSLFYVEDAEGNGKFVTGKPEYLVERGKKVDKKVYNESTAKDKRVNIVPDMKAGHIYTTDQLAKQIATSTQIGKEQWNRYEAGKPQPEVSKTISGIDEMVWNKMDRGYNNGKMSKGLKWKNHDDHIHIGATDPNRMLAIIKKAQSLGLNATQNPFTGKVDKVHTDTSWHYENFDGTYEGKKLGNGLDVSGNESKMKELFEWVEGTQSNQTPSNSTTKSKKDWSKNKVGTIK